MLSLLLADVALAKLGAAVGAGLAAIGRGCCILRSHHCNSCNRNVIAYPASY